LQLRIPASQEVLNQLQKLHKIDLLTEPQSSNMATKVDWSAMIDISGTLGFLELFGGSDTMLYSWNDEVVYICCDIPHPFFNVVFPQRKFPQDKQKALQMIDDTMKIYNQRKNPVLWLNSTALTPPNLASYLPERKIARADGFTGMALDLATEFKEVHEKVEKFEVVQVETEQQFEDWVQVEETVYGIPQGVGIKAFAHLRNNPYMSLFIGYFDKKPVTASGMYYMTDEGPSFLGKKLELPKFQYPFKLSEVATMFFVATLPEYRKKGLGKLVCSVAVAQAKQRGCKYCNLIATDMGKPVYEHLGFKSYHIYEEYMKATFD